jgi:rhodanese-related sulfurtransferase
MINVITPEDLKNKMDQEDLLLVDVREKDEHDFEHIEGDMLIPLSELTANKLPHTDKTIVFYCRSGMRSQSAYLKILADNEHLVAYSLKGGIEGWKACQLPVVKNKKSIPIIRQVMIVAGFLSFTGVVLGKSYDESFYYLSGFVGLGLMFAGITGWCGMAIILGKMPWNRCEIK